MKIILLFIYVFFIGYGFNEFLNLKNREGIVWSKIQCLIYFLEHLIFSPFIAVVDFVFWVRRLMMK